MSQELRAKLIDTHCHLDFPEFDQDRDEVISRALLSGLDYIINVGSSIEGSRNSVEMALKYSSVYAAVGVHPHEADRAAKDVVSTIEMLAKKDKVVAIGEIGLDYYKNYSQAENQRSLFISLMKLAKDLDKPVVLHSRQAEIDTLKIVKDFLPLRCVVHCFSGDETFLQQCLDLGFFVSFTCNITYKKAENLRKVVKAAPLDKMMLETDTPYLSPEGFRGKRNEPNYVKQVALEIAKVKEIDLEKVAAVTTENAKQFFNLK